MMDPVGVEKIDVIDGCMCDEDMEERFFARQLVLLLEVFKVRLECRPLDLEHSNVADRLENVSCRASPIDHGRHG